MGATSSKNHVENSNGKVCIDGNNITHMLPNGFDKKSLVFKASPADKTRFVNLLYHELGKQDLEVEIKTPRLNDDSDSTCTWKLVITSVEKRHIPHAY